MRDRDGKKMCVICDAASASVTPASTRLTAASATAAPSTAPATTSIATTDSTLAQRRARELDDGAALTNTIQGSEVIEFAIILEFRGDMY